LADASSDASVRIKNLSEQVPIRSADGGDTWTAPGSASPAGDRPDYAAIAISPDGTDTYLVYTNHLDVWRSTTADARRMQGVVRHGTGTLTGSDGSAARTSRVPA